MKKAIEVGGGSQRVSGVRKWDPRIFQFLIDLSEGCGTKKSLKSFAASGKHHESIESIYWLQESTENLLKIMFCVDAVLVRREKGEKFFFRPMRAVKVDRKGSLMKSKRIWWKMDGIAWRVVQPPGGGIRPEVADFVTFSLLKIHFFEFLSIFDSARAKWHSRFFVFFVNQPHRHSLHLFTRKGILPHELIYILITLLRLENFRASFGIFSHFSRFFVSLLISLRNRSENKVRSEKERRKYPCSSTSTASSTEKHV